MGRKIPDFENQHFVSGTERVKVNAATVSTAPGRTEIALWQHRVSKIKRLVTVCNHQKILVCSNSSLSLSRENFESFQDLLLLSLQHVLNGRWSTDLKLSDRLNCQMHSSFFKKTYTFYDCVRCFLAISSIPSFVFLSNIILLKLFLFPFRIIVWLPCNISTTFLWDCDLKLLNLLDYYDAYFQLKNFYPRIMWPVHTYTHPLYI